MIKTSFATVAAALVLAVPASSQQLVCAVGYTSVFSSAGVAFTSTDEDQTVDPLTGAMLVSSRADCLKRTFLSSDPSVFVQGDDFTDNGRRPWDLAFRGSARGALGATASMGYYGNGTGNEGWHGAGRPSAVIDPSEAGTGSNAVPGTICAYFGGTDCTDPSLGLGFGNDGITPGDDLRDNHQQFVDAIHNANGTFGNIPGNGGTVGNGGTPGGNGGGAAEIDPIFVGDLVDVGAGTADVAPEPATMTLLATGLVGLAAGSRRKRKK